MGKISAAKKKERRKDFNKVKFKVGKKLPKNVNETRATFKAKTLILKKQFQLEKEGPVSHRNLSWRDLLAHLGHHNLSIKLDALSSLKEMISANHDIIRLDLNNFLESICPLFSDRDYKVREACMQLFKTFILLPDFAQKKKSLEPFYSLLNVHLSCAMTHISENVQYDSLKLLDILIENLADLVRINAYTIFENFVDQISKATLKGDKRTLKNDPYKMTSTQTWRSKVLGRILKMLLIVSAAPDVKSKATQSLESSSSFDIEANTWTTLPKKSKTVLIQIDQNNQCSISSFANEADAKSSLQICKRLTAKKNLTESSEFFEHYFKIISPLLVDCWIEARPDNKSVIESYESLSIMHSVMSILNLLLENLKFGFDQLGHHLRSSAKQNQLKYIENLFIGQFPYCLAENFEYTNDSKKTNAKISANTINLLLCKFCSSSLLQLTDTKLLEIFQYSLSSLVVTKDEPQNKLELAELTTLLNLSRTIFSNFSNTEITKPFLVALTKYFDAASKFSFNKWLVFEFLCNQFYENDNLKDCEGIFLSFFKKIFAFCISYEKEKKERIEALIDCIRNLIIKKEKSQPIILNMLEDEYINILNALDFESKEISESCKKKVLELIYWLPKINRFLFTKLSILILKKNLSIVNTNQILGILKTRLDKMESSFDLSDYLMFLTSLFNASSSFDLMNASPSSDFYTLDHAKFSAYAKLCVHLELFVSSHQNSDVIVDIIASSSIPVFSNLPSVTCRTLYGSLALISQLESFESIPDIYDATISWIMNAQLWLFNKLQTVQLNQLGTREEVEIEIASLTEISNKILAIYKKNARFLNDSIPHLLKMLQCSNNLDHLRKIFVVVNHLIVNFQSTLKPSVEHFFNVYKAYQSFNDSNYIWWHEFCNLLKTF